MIKATMRDIYIFNAKLGLRRIIGGIDYFRCLEDPLVFNNLELIKGLTLLDIGSGTTIFPLFASSKGVHVLATDINNSVLKLGEVAEKFGIAKFCAEIQDVRNLSYPDNHFDRVSAISTLEHIPNDGDFIAIKEMARVLKVSGVMVITVPYGSYEEERQRSVSYFQRVYGKEDLYERLIKPSGLDVVKIEYFGERRYDFTNYWRMIPSSLRIPLLWAQPIFSKLFLGVVKDVDSLSRDEKNVFMKTGGVCLTLKKSEGKYANK